MAPKIKTPPILSRFVVEILSQVDWVRLWVLFLALGFLFFLGLILGYVLKLPGLPQAFTVEAPLPVSSSEASSSAAADWVSFTHPTVSYSFRYPGSWQLKEEASSSATTVNLFDPRLNKPNVLPRLAFAVVEDNLNPPGFPSQVVFGEVVGQKITLSSPKEPLREGYLISLPSLKLLVKTAPVGAGFDYTSVYKEILATLSLPQESIEKKERASSGTIDLTLSAQQKDEYIQFRLRAAAGNLTKVRFFEGDNLLHELPARPLGGLALPTTFEVQSEATKLSRQWLQTEKELPLTTYVYRHHRDWSAEPESCLPTQAYLHIFTAKGKYYDVRLSEDLASKKVCFEGEGIQVEENWYYLWQKPEAGTYKISAKVYDTEGREAAAQIPRFQVR